MWALVEPVTGLALHAERESSENEQTTMDVGKGARKEWHNGRSSVVASATTQTYVVPHRISQLHRTVRGRQSLQMAGSSLAKLEDELPHRDRASLMRDENSLCVTSSTISGGFFAKGDSMWQTSTTTRK